MPFSDEQIDTILSSIDNHLDRTLRNKRTLPLNLEKFQRDFNAKIYPFLNENFDDDPKLFSVMEDYYLIKNCLMFPGEDFDIVANLLVGTNIIFGAKTKTVDNFKLLTFAHVFPETKTKMLTTGMLLTAFMEVLLPKVDVAKFLRETTAKPTFVKNGVRFFFESHDNISVVTAFAK